MTVNLLNGGADPAALERLLSHVRPDVVVAQEVGTNVAAVLQAYAPHGQLVPSEDNRGRALLSIHPIECRRLALPWRDGTLARVRFDGHEVTIVGVHLANPIDGIKAVPTRRAQLRELEPVIASADRCVLAGDLNATPLWPAYRRLVSHLDDPIADWARSRGERLHRTWGPRPGWPALLRIDHVLGRGVRVVDHRVHPVEGSDHRAVEVTIVPDEEQ